MCVKLVDLLQVFGLKKQKQVVACIQVTRMMPGELPEVHSKFGTGLQTAVQNGRMVQQQLLFHPFKPFFTRAPLSSDDQTAKWRNPQPHGLRSLGLSLRL